MKYLVPTDFSDCAQNASHVAIDMAQKSGAEVVFLHLMTLPIDWVTSNDKRRQSMYPATTKEVERIEEKLKEWKSQAEKVDVETSSHIHYNEYKDFINQFAHDEAIDLIIMGSHGAHDLKDYFVGTNTQRVVRFSKIPVLVVKERIKEVNKIALISDFSRENVSTEPAVTDFVKLFKAGFNLAFINTPLNFNSTRVIQKRLSTFQADFDFTTNTQIYNDYQFESGVTNYCKDYGVDIVIMNTHGRKGIDLAVAGSLTENIIANVNIPVLCLPITIHE
ncbi:hypothetical protein E1176_12155 [Fulvivirga sp. RKSG066]|uniref:universal stress protein n=1 Tax=Fulvivirga aurantia TaxID=2529383 RepID=UPI0012BC271D|nr:universal stress protein [Fulvivirga aurantia]MTI21775.1 hypothetical protein [Fulvivirga aurantia]